MHYRRAARAALAAVTGLMALDAQSLTFSWTFNGSGSYDLNTNWAPAGGPPDDLTDTAIFSLASTYTVNFSIGRSINAASVRDGTVTLNLGGQTFTLDTSLTVGTVDFVPARLTLTNGTVQVSSGTFHVGDSSGTSGSLTLTSGGTLTSTPPAVIGTFGQGVCTV